MVRHSFHYQADLRSQVVLTGLQSITELLHTFCAECGISHCRGCMSPVQCASPCGQLEECDTIKCCARVRVIAIFEILGILDFHYLNELSNSQKRVNNTVTKASKKRPSAAGPAGTGYATDVPEFDGFGGYDDDVDMDGQHGWGLGDPAGHLEWVWGSDGFSPGHSGLSPWGGGWDTFNDSEPS